MQETFADEATPQRVTKEVFVIVKRPPNKSLWIRIGSAWENRDGSLNVLLHALPANGEIQIRDPRPVDTSLHQLAATAA